MNLRPKGVLFWAAASAVAVCYTLGISKGVLAFGILAVAILILG